MEDNYKKKKAKIILVAILSLLVLVLGSAYAYFQVSTVNNFGTKNIYADTGGVGTVVIEGIDASLTMNLTASELMYDYTQQTPAPVIYYAGTNGTTTTPTEVVVGTARVNPNTDTNYYHCTYDISVTHTGTNDMYDKFNSKTNNVYDYTNRSEGQIALLINGVEYDWGSEDGMPALIHAELNMFGTETKNITAGLKFVSSDQIDQSYITGTDIDIEVNLVPNTLRCTVIGYIVRDGIDETTGLPVVKIGNTEEFYDITNVIDYSSLDSTFLTKINYDSSKSILLAKYNLYVGQNCTSSSSCTPISTSASEYGLQSVDAKGFVDSSTPRVGAVPVSGSSTSNGYWYDSANSTIYSKYGTYTNRANNIYDTTYSTAPNYSIAFSNNAGNANYSIAYYVEEYVDRLGIEGEGRLLTYTEAAAMTQTQITNGARYWLGSAYNYFCVWSVDPSGNLINNYVFFNTNSRGVRPVIVINTSYIH